MKIKCIAIDDEPLALKQISSYIEKTPFLEQTAFCQSAFEALELLEEKDVDLLFVDINMPDLNGLDFVKSLTKRPQIIFTTAYSEYAIDGFQVDAIDYLLKPIAYTSFLKAVNKARTWFELKQQKTPDENDLDKEIFVKSEYKMVRVLLSDILYIESANEYIRIHLDNSEVITTLMRLKNMKEQLGNTHFMRVHRSFIVALAKIKEIERYRISMGTKIIIPIGEQYREAFQEYMDKRMRINNSI